MSWRNSQAQNGTENGGALPGFYKKPAQQTNQFQFQPKKRAPAPQNENINPVSNPQVAEDSRAEKAGLKLGDAILTINGQVDELAWRQRQKF